MANESDVAFYKLDEWAQKTPDETFIYYGKADLALSFANIKRRADQRGARCIQSVPLAE